MARKGIRGLAPLKQVHKEVYKNVKSYKIPMTPPLKHAKILNKEEQPGGFHLKLETVFCKIKIKGIVKQAQECRAQHDKKTKNKKLTCHY